MAEDIEVPVEIAPKTEILSDQDVAIAEVDKHEVRVNATESSLIEDQTMPSYLSIASNASSLKPDDSKLQPDLNDENVKPVYDVSSGDEEQEHSYHDDEDDDDDDDNDDEEDENDYDNDNEDYDINRDHEDSNELADCNFSRRYRRTRKMRYDESEDEDCEEDEENRDSDGDMRPEQFERSSDDFILRTSNSNLERPHIERSRSLQDLTSPKKSPRFQWERRLLIDPGYVDMKTIPGDYNDIKHDSFAISKYSLIPNKSYRCVQDIRERNKRLIQRIFSYEDNLNSYAVNVDHSDIIEEADNLRPNPQRRRLKSYAESTLTNIAAENLSHGQTTNITNMKPKMNGEVISIDAIKNYHQVGDNAETMKINDGNEQNIHTDKQISKPNGTIEYLTNNTRQSESKENGVTTQLVHSINGKPASDPIGDAQTLTYDIYMKGNVDKNLKSDGISKKNFKKYINTDEIMVNPVNLSAIASVHAENMVTDESPLKNEINNRNILDNTGEISLVNSRVSQKPDNYIEEKNEEYKKIINENLQLKKEINELKKLLASQQDGIKRKEMKIAAVQTENQPRLMKHTSTTTHLQPLDKLSANMIPDVGSTFNSIEHWTDSEYSPIVSLKPPNVDDVLNSEQSTLQNTPKNPSQAASRALWTTNRILQTLANLTPGREIPNMTEKKFDAPGQSKDPISPLISGRQNLRKRKASDITGTSVFEPIPSKIPFTNVTDMSRKFNSTCDTHDALNSVELSHRVSAATAVVEPKGVETEPKHDNESADDDDIKCFIWHEDVDTQERSCLIQAPIGPEGSSKIGESKKHARECGPYLLGNLEVRITEANGTLNIWGKEVNQNSILRESNIASNDLNEKNNDPNNSWPKTPDTMVDNHFNSSTNKKIKMPSSTRANISRNLRDILYRTPSLENAPMEMQPEDIPNVSQCGTNNCDSCHNYMRLFSPVCHNYLDSQMKSSCCAYKSETNVRSCGCQKSHEPKIENSHCHYGMVKNRMFPMSNQHCGNLRQNHVCVDHFPVEENCKHNTRHQIFDSETGNCRHAPKKRCYSNGINNCSRDAEKISCQEMNAQMEVNTSCNRFLSAEADPAVTFDKSDEIPEKRHHLRCKRVRNIVDFLKGCRDCRNPDTSSMDSCQISEAEATNIRSNPSSRVISDPSIAPCRKKLNHSENYKECNSCVQYAGRSAELEAELEVMRVEISKLHSRSNAMRDTLQRVLQTDLNTS